MAQNDGSGKGTGWRIALPQDLADKVNAVVKDAHLSPSEVFEIAFRVMDNASQEDVQRAYEATLTSRAQLFASSMGFSD